MVAAADSVFGLPTDALVWRIWRWRFDRSTTSESTSPIVPTPAAARYKPAGEPSPPAPTSSTLEASSFACPASPTSGTSRWRL